MNLSSSNSQSTADDQKLLHEKISSRAIALWKAYGCPANRDDEIWLEAERQLVAETKEPVRILPASSASSAPSSAPAKETEITASPKVAATSRVGKRRVS